MSETINKQTPVTIGVVVLIVIIALAFAGTAGIAKVNRDDIKENKNSIEYMRENYITKDEFNLLNDDIKRMDKNVDKIVDKLIN